MEPLNGVMMQFFHWYIETEPPLWNRVQSEAKKLSHVGITSLWLPPAYKAENGTAGVGYAVYDLYDLGEFNQKGSVRTRYGTRDQYVAAIESAHQEGIQVYGDIVLNHRMGGDEPEEFCALPINPEDRTQHEGGLQPIKAFTHFTFPGRQGKYSPFQFHWEHFTACDHNDFEPERQAIYLFEGKEFDDRVDGEKGNFDYLMGFDVDVNHPDVRKELFEWGTWMVQSTGIDGFRIDAVKHVDAKFFPEWLRHCRESTGKELFAVGEYLSSDTEALEWFLGETEGTVKLFDFPLNCSFYEASLQGAEYDLSRIFDGSLVQSNPTAAVTFVENHDTQPLQALERVVQPWFRPLAYALILLRNEGYPCVFYADYYGACYTDKGQNGEDCEIWLDSHQWILDRLLVARQMFCFGETYEAFDDPHVIGWAKSGDTEHPGGVAVVMSNDQDGTKRMQVGLAETEYVDITEHIAEPVLTDAEGYGEFRCLGGKVSVWVDAQGAQAIRDRLAATD